MKPAFLLLIAFALAAAAAAARAEDKSPALYSFSDICRLTSAGLFDAPALADAGEPRIRPAAVPADAEPRFSVSPLREPGRWILLFAGLAAAGWVAHRRLSHSF